MSKKPGADGCHSIAYVIKRFENVNNLYQNVKKEGKLRSRKEIYSENY